MLALIYAVLMVAGFVISAGVIGLIATLFGGDSDDAAKAGVLTMTLVAIIYFYYLVVQANPLGLAFQSS
tara:strand:- start:897 stop:1103 length:207 start_codon:yes stop_codon:yes gene_type:complete